MDCVDGESERKRAIERAMMCRREDCFPEHVALVLLCTQSIVHAFSHKPAGVLLCALSMRKWDEAQVMAQ